MEKSVDMAGTVRQREVEDQMMESALRGPGFRMTKQRRLVYDLLVEIRDHPTATEVFFRAKERMRGISLATVYNCLETLVEVGMVKQVHVDRSASRYCPNLHDHAHFYCRECGSVVDVEPVETGEGLKGWKLREGTRVDFAEVALKGLCPECACRIEASAGN